MPERKKPGFNTLVYMSRVSQVGVPDPEEIIARYQKPEKPIKVTPKDTKSEPNPLTRYPWGIFSMMREIADYKSGSLTEDNQTQRADAKSIKPLRLEPRADRLRAEALAAEENGQEAEAKSLYLDAATEARAVYDTIPTQEITESDALVRAQHAEVTVIEFINAGALDDARNLTNVVLGDKSIPPIYKARVQKTIELLGQTPQGTAKEVWDHLTANPEFVRRVDTGLKQLDAGERIPFVDDNE